MKALHKVISLVFVQATFILLSFVVVSYIELQHASGKIIDISGKTRLLATAVQLETYRTLFHDSATHVHVELAIEELEHNTALLQHGGIMEGIDISPLPQELHSELDEMVVAIDQYKTVVTEVISSKESLTYDNVETARVLSDSIVEMANDMTAQLDDIIDDDAEFNSLLLIFLGIGNIVVLTLITFLVWNIIQSHIDRTVIRKRFEALGKFSAVMAHNIRNPLGSLYNSIELIKMSNLDSSLYSETARMERSIKRISHHVESILHFVNGTPLKIRSVMLSNVLCNAVDMLVLPKNIDLHMPDDDQNINVECDDKKIEFVLYNLLINAVQAIGLDQGRIVVRTRDGDVEANDKNGTVILEFENSGPSIPPHVLPRVFDPLFTTKKDGIGLGLSYCKNVVKLHKGRITASNRDETVLFSIHLPKTQTLSQQVLGGGGNGIKGLDRNATKNPEAPK